MSALALHIGFPFEDQVFFLHHIKSLPSKGCCQSPSALISNIVALGQSAGQLDLQISIK